MLCEWGRLADGPSEVGLQRGFVHQHRLAVGKRGAESAEDSEPFPHQPAPRAAPQTVGRGSCPEQVFEVAAFHAASERGTDRSALRRSVSVSTPANGVIWRRSTPCWVRASIAVTISSNDRSRRSSHSSSQHVEFPRSASRSLARLCRAFFNVGAGSWRSRAAIRRWIARLFSSTRCPSWRVDVRDELHSTAARREESGEGVDVRCHPARFVCRNSWL